MIEVAKALSGKPKPKGKRLPTPLFVPLDHVLVAEIETNGRVSELSWNGQFWTVKVLYFLNGKQEYVWCLEDELESQ